MPSHRYSLISCQRFLPIIRQVVDQQPDALEVDISDLGISLSTASARLRDAVRAYGGENPDLASGPARKAITDGWKNYEVAVRGEQLFVRKKGKMLPSDKVRTTVPLNMPVLAVNDPSLPVLNAVILLVSERLIPSAMILTDDPDRLHALCNVRDVAVQEQTNGGFVIC